MLTRHGCLSRHSAGVHSRFFTGSEHTSRASQAAKRNVGIMPKGKLAVDPSRYVD